MSRIITVFGATGAQGGGLGARDSHRSAAALSRAGRHAQA